MNELDSVLAELRAEWGLDYPRVRSLLALLAAGRGATTTELVEETGLPRRNVEAVLRALEPFREVGAAPAIPAGDVPGLPDADRLTAQMEDLAAGLPPSLGRLDHVPATPATMAARALHLASSYELAGASVVCLGDHDLTSLALGLVAPSVDVAVVDIDELILDHIRTRARAAGNPVTTAAADLRLGLPVSFTATADLVFTDPPYTPEGIRLFLARAVEALRRHDHARIVFCFGTGERHLVKVVEVQGVLSDLRLAVEAVLPGFNRYRGAEAIGSRSSLYVCRPTPRTWSRRLPVTMDPRIYTRGPEALEAAGVSLPGATVDVPTFVARTAAWATGTKAVPPPFGTAMTLDLRPHFGASLTRLLLLSGAERVVFVAPERALAASGWLDPADPVHRLLESAFDVVVERPGRGGPAVASATRHGREPADPAGSVLAQLVTRPGGKVVNVWREGLVAWGRRHGIPLTKNDARGRIDAARLDPALRRLRPYELSRSALAELVGEVDRSAADLRPEPPAAT